MEDREEWLVMRMEEREEWRKGAVHGGEREVCVHGRRKGQRTNGKEMGEELGKKETLATFYRMWG